jgi:hypothetical protein
MSNWEYWYIIGTDLAGRRCRVAQVTLPRGLTTEQALRNLHSRPEAHYRIVCHVERGSEIERG